MLELTKPLIQRLPAFSQDRKRTGNKVATHFHGRLRFTSSPVRHRVPSHFNWTLQNLGMSETVPLLPLYVFMAWRVTT